MIRDSPSVLPSYIQAELRDIAIQRYSSLETFSRINLALFNERMKNAPDPAVYVSAGLSPLGASMASGRPGAHGL